MSFWVGAVAKLVGIEGGVVSGVFNLELSGVERRTGDHAMTSITTKPDAVAACRPRRRFIFSTTGLIRSKPACAIGSAISSRRMIRSELDAALARPRYAAGEAARAAMRGRDRRHRPPAWPPITVADWEPSADGDRRCRAPGSTPLMARRREWKSKALRAYQRRTLAADALIASTYLAGTNTRRVRRALAALFGGAVGKDTVSRVWRKVKTDWEAWNARSLADEPIVRLILDGTVVRVRLDRKATSISLLVVIGVREDGQKVLLAVKNMGGESDRGLAHGARRPDRPRPAPAGVPHRRRRAGAGEGDRRRLGRRAGPTLHGSQASQPARPRARAPARGDHRRLHRHDLRRDAPRRSKRGARPSSASGGSSTGPSPTAWRKPATACSPSPACRRANGEAPGPPTPSSGCTRSSSGGSRRRPCCPRPTPPPCCSGRCSPPVRSTCARSMAGRRSPPSPSISRLTSPPEPITSCYRRSRHADFQPLSRRYRRRASVAHCMFTSRVCRQTSSLTSMPDHWPSGNASQSGGSSSRDLNPTIFTPAASRISFAAPHSLTGLSFHSQ